MNIVLTVITGVNFQMKEKTAVVKYILEMWVQLRSASFFIAYLIPLIYEYELLILGREDFICSISHACFISSHRTYL